MKRDISLWQTAGFALTSLGGTLLHYLYDLTGGNILTALFSGVNESTWEHMKLLYFPMLAFALVQSRFFKDYGSFWCVKLIGILTGLTLIPALFYTYNGVFGKSPDAVNIAIFFVSAALAFLLETRLFKENRLRCKRPRLAFALILLIGALFVLFTFVTPEIPLFLDPITGTYGLNGWRRFTAYIRKCSPDADGPHRGSALCNCSVNIGRRRYLLRFAITSSISEIDLGVTTERFSQPVSVMRQLSSRRKPMPHSGT